MWDKAKNDWTSGAWYTLADGTKKVKKFTYAMTRASLQDGAGANAIWNITNVTRSDRHYLYTTPAWAKYQSEDPEVISYIKKHGADESSVLHPYYADGTDEGIKERVNEILSCNNAAKSATFEKYLLNGAPYNGEEEMSDKDYYDFMVWQFLQLVTSTTHRFRKARSSSPSGVALLATSHHGRLVLTTT